MFADLTKNFTTIRKDVNRLVGDRSIVESIDNIVSNNINTKKLLFKNNTSFILFDLIKQIEFSLYSKEPRIENINIRATYNKRDESLDLFIRADIKNDEKTVSFSKRI